MAANISLEGNTAHIQLSSGTVVNMLSTGSKAEELKKAVKKVAGENVQVIVKNGGAEANLDEVQNQVAEEAPANYQPSQSPTNAAPKKVTKEEAEEEIRKNPAMNILFDAFEQEIVDVKNRNDQEEN